MLQIHEHSAQVYCPSSSTKSCPSWVLSADTRKDVEEAFVQLGIPGGGECYDFVDRLAHLSTNAGLASSTYFSFRIQLSYWVRSCYYGLKDFRFEFRFWPAQLWDSRCPFPVDMESFVKWHNSSYLRWLKD